MAIIHNPRHPHTCEIFRMENEDEFTVGRKLVLYEGVCRKYTTQSARTSNITMTSQYTLSIPEQVKVLSGDRVSVDDGIGHFEGVVTEATVNNIGAAENGYIGGTDIFWNSYKH